MKWIKCSVRLPIRCNGVLVTDGLLVGFAMYNREICKWVRVEEPWENFRCNVTHWMELPDPPEIEE